MRILHIDKFAGDLSRRAGGASRHIRALGRLQADRGHQVSHFGCVGPKGPAEMPRFRRFNGSRSPIDLLRMIHNAGAAGKLSRFLDRRPVDVAHLHNIYHHLTPSILPVLARHKTAIVMTVHDYRLACPARHLWRSDGLCSRCLPSRFYHAASPRCGGLGGAALAIESATQRFSRRYLSWVDRFCCPTRYMMSVLAQAGVPAGKLSYLPHPVDIPSSDDRDEMSSDRLLYAGRLSEEKGPGLMLDLADRMKDVKVVLAGDGPLAESLRDDATSRGLGNVEFPGWLDEAALQQHYARAAATIIPSRCMENSPLVMLEAMAAGCCVIVPDQPPLCEEVADGVTGRTFATGDIDSLTRVVGEVLADQPGRAKLAASGRDHIGSLHEPNTTVEALGRIYEDAIRRCALRW